MGSDRTFIWTYVLVNSDFWAYSVFAGNENIGLIFQNKRVKYEDKHDKQEVLQKGVGRGKIGFITTVNLKIFYTSICTC